jgi:hypothetical protein
MDDARRLRARLGGVDRARLDEHLAAVATLAKRVSGGVSPAAAGPSCAKPPAAPGPTSFAQDGKAQSDLLAMALACDLTRVAVLQWACGQSELNHSFLGNGINHGHHWMSHYMSGGPDQLKVIQRFHIQQLANLATSMDRMKEGDRSVLDNTAIVLMSEISEGPTHSFNDMPFLVLGGCGGAVKTGQVLDGGGRAHNDVWVALLNAMGIADTTFGDPKLNKGPLPGLLA